MTDDFLSLARERQLRIILDNGRIRIFGAKSALDDKALISALKTSKSSILDFLVKGGCVEYNGLKGYFVPPNLIPEGCMRILPEMLPLVALDQDEIDRIVEAVPGGVRNVQDIYPLAPLQEGILFHHLMSEGGDPYLLWTLLSFDERRQLERYVEALNAVIARHDILRTAVAWEGLREPVQVVWRRAPLLLEDTVLDPASGEAASQLRKRFDPRAHRLALGQAPLMRLYAAQDPANGRWIVMWLFHHLSSDHTTLERIQDEVHAHLNEHVESLPPPSPFRNFVAQARLGVSQEEHEAFFREMLADVEEPTAPFGLLDVQGDGSEVREARLKIEDDLARRLHASARRLGVGVASLCHVAWAQVLSRSSGRKDVVFGTVLFGRMQGGEGTDHALGLFINTLPIRIAFQGEGAALCVKRAHTLLADLLQHEHASLALAQRCSAVPPPAPLFSALLNYRHNTVSAGEERQTRSGLRHLGGEERTNYPVTLSVDATGSSLSLNAQVVPPLDPSHVCALMDQALRSLADALESAPGRPVEQLDILPAEERRRLLVDWNATEADYPAQACLHQLFEAQVEAGPDAVALVFGEATLSYAALNMRANQLAQRLRQLGVGPDVRVAICVERSLEMVTGMLAVLKAGGAYVPLDPTYPLDRLTFMLADSGPRVVLTHAPARDILAQALERVNVPLQVVDLDPDLHQDLPSHNLDLEDLGLTSSHLAYVIYTSGSTGTPKGVMIEHKSITNRLLWMQVACGLQASDSVIQKTPIGFDVSVWELIGTVSWGARLVIVPPGAHKDPKELSCLMLASGASTVHFVPSMLETYIDDRFTSESCSLSRIICSGESLSAELVRRCNDAIPAASLYNFYGPTEATIDVTSFEFSAKKSQRVHVPIGRPISNTRIYILDDRMEPVPTGAAGELYIGGAGVARGYLNRPDLTAERFLASPFVAGDRLYKTGDLGRYLPDGNIEFLGRNDFQVKIRGFRIELGEIEARLVERADVGQAVVLAREDAPGDKRLVAYYVAAGGHDPDVAALRAYLAERLPEYMVPAAYVRLDALPLTPNGKLDRKTLPAPDASAFSVRTYEPPLGAVEEALAAIWAEVLGLERVGRNDNFFELGGHSLLAVRVLGRMRQEGLRGNVKDLFASPTLTEWAHSVQNAHSGVVVPPNLIPEGCMRILPEMLPLVALDQDEIDRIVEAVPGGVRNVQDIYPLAPLQEGILFHHLMSEGGDPYLLWTLLSFDERRQLERYVEALNAVIARHDILRTAVAWEGLREPVQVVWRRAPLLLEDTVLDPASGEAASQLRKRFDPRAHRLALGQAPLMRLYAAQDPANGRWIVMWLFHHLSSDHTTLERIQDEVHAHLNEHVESLPPPSPFRNFVAQARLGVSQEEHEAFFREMLADVEEPTAPFGLLDVQGDGSEVREARLKIEDDLARRLHASARRLGVGVASLCHVAWAQVLSRSSGRKDVVFGTVLFGRMQGGEGTDHALGLFINTLPIRIAFQGEGAALCVKRAHTLLADLLQHEHASLALAQRCSAVPPPAPLFSALLNYRHNTVSAGEERQTRSGLRHLGGEERTNYPVTLSVDATGSSLSLNAQVVPPLDPSHVCALMDQALRSLADALESAPGRPVEQLDILPAEERRRLLVDWNATEADYPAQACLHQLFEAQVEAGPDAVALVFGEATLSYAALNMRANQLAQRLRQLGVGPDVRVAICVERSLEMVTGMLAVLKAGGAYVPLDPTYPLDRLTFMLADSGPRVVLTHAPARDILAQALERVNVPLQVVDLDPDLHQDLPSHNLDLEDLGLTSSHLAYVIYTSGSTGTPKGVMIEHKSITNLTHWHFVGLQQSTSEPTAGISSLSFDAFSWELWPVLYAASYLVIFTGSGASRLAALSEAVRVREVTLATVPPSAISGLTDISDLDGLECLILAGEPLQAHLARKWGRHRRLINAYGPTEATVCASVFHVDLDHLHSDTVPIGRPISNTRIYILDDRMEPVPTGAAGELYIGGAGVARGYLNRPDLTAERFLASPFVAGDRLYKTGDLGRYLPDGNIEFLGRNDFQVKIRGFRIELGEIEARLVERADVGQAVVLAREDAPGDKRLVAYYVAAGGHDPDVAALRAYLAERLPEYMVPAAYVRLDALPLTPNGKLDRKTLPAPDASAFSVRTYEPPLGAVEEALAAIWAEVLGLERVGRNDNFFELGGHSLLAVRVLGRMRQEGLRGNVKDLFASPTLTEWAHSVQNAHSGVVVPPNLIPEGCMRILPEMLPLVALDQDEIDRIVEAVPGGVRNVQDIYPLAPLQEGILFHHLMSEGGDPYLLWTLLSFDERRQLERYVEALNAVIARHDILRTAVAWEGLREPVQVVWRRAPLLLEDTVLDPASGEAASQLRKRFDPRAHRLALGQAPLMRLYAAQDPANGRWIVMWLFHHLSSDHTTLERIQDEVHAHLNEHVESLPPPSPFRNFVAQARLGVSQEEHEAFFREMLADVEEPTAPFGLLDVQGDGSEVREARLKIEDDLARRLHASARRLGVGVASLCHVAWAQVLSRSSGRKDVVFGTVLFGRMQGGEGTDHALGLFINTLPIRIAFQGEGAALCVKRAHTLLADLLQHEHASLALAQRCSAVPPPAPLFSALLNYRHNTVSAGEERQTRSGLRHLGGEERTNYPVTLSVDATGSSLSLNAQVVPPLDPSHVCALMDQALRSLADALESAPGRPVEQLDILPAEERRRLLVDWNATEADYPAQACLHQLFEAQVEAGPDAVALVFGEATLSYAALNMRANQLAQRLRQLGVGPDVRVAICVERSLEMVTGMLAVLKAGGAYVPLDPTYPLDRLTFMLADSGPRVVLTHAPARDILAQALERVNVPLQVVDLDPDLHQDLPSHNLDLEDLGLTSSHLAYVIYTSGSTGTPKGVMIEHKSITNRLLWMQVACGLQASDSVIQKTPIGFDVSVWELIGTVSWGARLVIVPPGAHKDPKELSCLMLASGASTVHFVPSMLETYIDDRFTSESCSLSRIICSGESLSAELVRRCNDAIPAASLYNFYGPTEATIDVTSFEFSAKKSQRVHVPIGRPISNTRIYILDDRMEPVPTGAAGELYIGGAGVARGYLNRPDLTAERFLASPFVAGDRLYKTGDLGRYLPDGNIEFLGRNDFQVKIRGFRIELGEIEARLVERADVGQAVVLAREDAPGDKRLVAYYVAAGGHDPDVAALRAYLAERLPEYMVPAAYVRLDALPLTPNGKLDRKTLPAPDASAFSVRTYEPPLGAVEEALAAIWAEVLGLERVGRNDNFFELGGHSLLAVRVLGRMRQEGLRGNVKDLFASPTLTEWAHSVQNAHSGVVVPPNLIPEGCMRILPEMLPLVALDQDEIDRIVEAVPGGVRNVQDIYPLAPLQEGILFHHLMSEGGDPYLLWTLLSFDERRQLERYVEALNAVIARHDILRTAVAWEGLREPVQVVWRRAPLLLEDTVLDPASGEAASQLRKRFDPRAHRLALGQAPLMRLYAAQDPANGRWIVMWLFHHLSSDHTTLERIQDEVHAHLNEHVESLPPPSPFRNFVAQARLGVSQEEHEAFFREMLADVEEPTAPFGLLDVQGDGSEVREARLKIEDDLARRLHASARRLGVGVASLCHVAWAQVLSRSSGRKDVVFGTVLFGRMQGGEGTDHALGLFINTLPIRIAFQGEGAALCVKRAHTLLADLLQHEHASLALAQRCSAVPPPAPLFSALLNYRHNTVSAGEERQTRSGLRHLGGEERTNYPVTLSVDATGSSLSLNAQVVPPLDPSHVCALMDQALRSLADALESAPGRPVEQLDILPAEERRRLLVDWNATEADYPAQACLHQLFEAQVEAGPDAVALVFGEATLSYAALNMRANQLAQRLRQLGVGPDVRVAICVERSLEMVTGMLAVLKAGGAYVPLDPTYPLDRLTFMLADSGPRVVLTHAPARDILAQALERVNVPLQVVDLDPDLHQDLPSHNLDLKDLGLTSSHLAYVIYTSGSTGTPKGVMIEHKNVGNLIAWAVQQYNHVIRSMLLSTSFSFDLSVFECFSPLSMGGSAVLGAVYEAAISNATIINTVPTAARIMLERDLFPPQLRQLNLAGEALPSRLVADFANRKSDLVIINLYGPSETTTYSTSAQLCIGNSTVPIGRPISNTRIYILDDRMEPVPTGAAGELYIGGAGVARGYLNRPDLTAERFLASPFVAGDRLYKTGDLGRYLPDGNIEFLGRNDFQVKIRGFRIELGEIEARLVERADVGQAVVLAREDAPGDKRLVAYYVAAGGHDPDVAALRAYLAERLPEYMVPAAYVRLDALPLTPNGKLDRKTLPAPDASAFSVRTYEPPLGAVEEALAAIWAEVLGLERVGRNDNFFELGGHSLLAVRVLGRMRQEGLRGNVKDLFASPTLTEWAHSVQNAHSGVVVPPNLIPEGCMRILPEMLPLVALDQDEIDRIVEAVPGGVRNVQDIYPLAPLQEGILFHHLMSEGGDPYLLWTLLSFDERRQLERYVEALNAVIARHDILRTAVAWEGLREPVQVVWRRAPLLLEDTVLDPASGEAASQLRKRFDPRAHRLALGQAPLMRLYAAQDPANGRWIVMWLFHHLSSDHTTLERIQDEVHAHLNEHVESLPPPSPFRNFVAQARLGVSQEEHEAFFREMLADVEEPTAPFGLLDVQGDGSEVREARLKIEDDLARRLHASARRLGVGVASLCHVAWAQVLSRSSGRKDVVFGTVLFGRMQGGEGTDHALGLFINTLPIRIAFQGEGAALCVKRAHTLLADLLQHEHASLALAQRCSAVPPPAPLFSALLNYRHNTVSAGEERQTRSGLRHLGGEERTNYPVTLSVDATGSSLSLNAQVVPPLDPSHVCALMDQALRSLADALESAPGRPVEQLDILPAEERRRLLVDWNATEADYPAQACLHQLFEAQVEAGPDAVALVFGEATLSYAALNMRANQLAQRLRQLGVGPDVRVAICVERSLEMVTGMLAVLKAGGAYVPLDPTYPLDRLTFMLADSGPRVVLTHAPARDILAQALERVNVPLQVVDLDPDLHQDLPSHNLDLEDLGLTSSHLAYVIYTSGSTGTPKGVMIEHKSINASLSARREFYDLEAPVSLCISSFSFDSATVNFFWPIVSGGTVIIEGLSYLSEANAIARTYKPSFVLCTPAAYVAASKYLSELRSSLALIILAGEELTRNVLNGRMDQIPSCDLVNEFGPTECAVWSSAARITSETSSVPIGRPISNTRIYILDDRMEPVPTGAAGELYIGGAGVARGYLNRPDLTAERFLASPFVAGDRLYKTGDLGRYLPDGNIEFLGRNDFQVKIRGFRIELGEIEARLVERADVGQAVVLAREDAPGDKRLVAYYVAAGGHDPDVAALRAYLAERLPEYMVPAAYVRLDALPLTPNGKLDRKTLPAPDASAFSVRTYEPPLGAVEEALAAIWAEVLGLERVGRNDNFFELGGHSLLAVRVLGRMGSLKGMEPSLNTFMSHGTISALARHITEFPFRNTLSDSSPTPASPALMLRSGGRRRLFLLHPLGGGLSYSEHLLQHIAPEFTIYGVHAYGPHESYSSLEALAIHYYKSIREIAGTEGAAFIGYSYGGYIAQELAHIHHCKASAFSLAILLDTKPPQCVKAEDRRRDTVLDFIDFMTDNDIINSSEMRRAKDILVDLLDDNSSYLRRIPESITACVTKWKHADIQSMFDTYCRHVKLLGTGLEVSRLKVGIHYAALHRAIIGQATPIDTADVQAAWPNASVVGVAANHQQMIRNPAVASLCHDLNHRLTALWPNEPGHVFGQSTEDQTIANP